MKARKLSKREFERAVKLGLGRAVLHVRDYGDEGMEDILKTAIKHFYLYDEMFETCRSWWIYLLLKHSGKLGKYAVFFFEVLKKEEHSMSTHAYHTKLAGLFFEDGFEQFRPIIIELAKRLIRDKTYNSTGANELIDNAAWTGFKLAIIELCKAGIDVAYDDCTCNDIFEYAESKLGSSEVEDCLKELEQKSPEVKVFREAVATWKDDARCSEPQKSVPTLKEILDLSKGEGASKNRVLFMRFGRIASEHDLERVFSTLMNTHSVEEQLCLLEVFSWRKPPRVTAKFISLLDSSDKNVVRACVGALSKCTEKRVREKALSMLKSSNEDHWPYAIELLRKNFLVPDATLILSALNQMKNPDNIHWSGILIDKIAKENNHTELAECFLWLYEFGPESY